MARLQRAFVRFRTSNWFALSLAILCVAWVFWNWLPWSMRFDEPPFLWLTLLLSVEASIATALVYQDQGRADAEFRKFLSESAAHQAERVKQILVLLEDELKGE